MPFTILLVEDESSIADNVLYALETEGFRTFWKTLGQDGLEALREAAVDLVILDVGLPDCSGFELCKAIRQFSEVPIIFLTARGEEIDRVVGLEIGGDDYVTKPFSPRELTARVKAVLKRLARETPSPQADFILDNGKAAIAYQGVDLNLTRTEFLLLKTLLSKPDYVFSRDRLIELVWNDPNTAGYDRAVDTHIKTLRAKLRQVHSTDPIKTHRGFGYSIAASCHEIRL